MSCGYSSEKSLMTPPPNCQASVESSNHSQVYVSNTSCVIDAGAAVIVLAVPEVVMDRPPITPALTSVGASLEASWPVAAKVRSDAVPYAAMAWSSVPVSAVGNVQCGSL